jgi:hypothetical protein
MDCKNSGMRVMMGKTGIHPETLEALNHCFPGQFSESAFIEISDMEENGETAGLG